MIASWKRLEVGDALVLENIYQAHSRCEERTHRHILYQAIGGIPGVRLRVVAFQVPRYGTSARVAARLAR